MYVHCTLYMYTACQPHTRACTVHTHIQRCPKAESIFYNFLAPSIFDEINMDYVQAAAWSPSSIRGEIERMRVREIEKNTIYLYIERQTGGRTNKKNVGENECEQQKKNNKK